MIHLPIERPGEPPSHLALRFDEPSRPGDRARHDELAVLYLHGFGSDQEGEKAAFFRRRAVAAGLAFCSLDFQGHGRSGGTMRGLTLSRNLEDAARAHRLLAERGYRRLIVLGSSMGGLTGLWYTVRHPESVVAGLHIAPGVRMRDGFLEFVGAAGVARWRRDGVFPFANEVVSCELGWSFVEDFDRYPLAELGAGLDRPTLLLQGKRDDLVPWRAVADFAAGCRHETVELHLFADGDHRLTDRKERLWALMHEFLAGRGLVLPADPGG